MKQKIIAKTLAVKGMTCFNCERRIENKLKKIPGVIKVEAKYTDETVQLIFDLERVNFPVIIEAIESLKYTVEKASGKKRNTGENPPAKQTGISNILGIIIIILAMCFLIDNTVGFNFKVSPLSRHKDEKT